MERQKVTADFRYEAAAIARGHGLIAGVDEAGRGPLAGPVVAAAVILDQRHPIAGLADSKFGDLAILSFDKRSSERPRCSWRP